MSLRDEIARIIFEGEEDADTKATQIIARFREALLSREAHQAATDKIAVGFVEGVSVVHIANAAITAALDAVTGDTP